MPRKIRMSNFKGSYFWMFLVYDLSLINKTWSCEEKCLYVKDNNICYFEVWASELDWDTAWKLCNSRNSTLPVIRNMNERDGFQKLLNVHMSGSVVWTSGRNHSYEEWTWIDGRPYSGRDGLLLSSSHPEHQPAFARATPFHDGLLIGDVVNPRLSYHYACQYAGSSCNQFSDAYTVQNGCIKYSDDERSWYDARNQCLITGGDLAVLDHQDRSILKDHIKKYDYWIGLTKTSWRWNLHQSTSEEDEIKYTNWSDEWNPLPGNCISIDASNGKWKAIGCSEKLKVVCQRDFVNATSSNSGSSGSSDSAEKDSHFVSYATFVYVAIGCICVIVISNIIVVLVVRRYFYQNTNTGPVIGTTANRCYYELETAVRPSNANDAYADFPTQPVYEEVHENIYQLGY